MLNRTAVPRPGTESIAKASLARRILARPRARPPAQRPLARQRVIVSRRVVAYYGLIRDTGPLRSTFAVVARSLRYRAKAQCVPTLLCASFAPCRLPYPGGAGGIWLLAFRSC